MNPDNLICTQEIVEATLQILLGERQQSRFTARVASWETLSGATAREKTSIFPRHSVRTKTALSNYSRDFTLAHLGYRER